MKLHESINRMRTLMKLQEGPNDPFYHGSPATFDRFDLSKVGTGDGLNKYGHGIYFTQNPDAAAWYAKELSIGDLRNSGLNVYECQLPEARKFVGWEEPIDSWLQQSVCESLRDMNLESDAETIEQESGENGYDMWTMRNLYEFLQHNLGGQAQTSAFLVDQGVPGIWASGVHAGIEDTVYVSFTDNIRIISVEKVS